MVTVLHRIDPDSNMHRFYRMEVVQGLFGDWSLIREWGRLGSHGHVRLDWFGSRAEAQNACDVLTKAKRRRGYLSV